MELKPKIGIDNIIFGMTQTDIEQILGKPDLKKVNKDDDNKIILVFNKHKLRLTFYASENNRLGYIETSNDKLTFNGINILNANINYAKKEIFGKLISEWEVDEYHSFTVYFNETYWLSLHVGYEVIDTVEIGVPFINDEEYEWPKLEKHNEL